MTSLRDQEKLDGDILPIILNVCNFAKAPTASRRCCRFDDARTLFHEFGHALHGLLSDVTYPLLSGTGVASDFVELPSQLYEHWLEEPEMLRALRPCTAKPASRCRRRCSSGCWRRAPSIRASPRSNTSPRRWSISTSTALPATRTIDVDDFESAILARIGMPTEIVMRHRPPHFGHVFSGGDYASAYYSYMWSEVLDADAFEAFKETGDVFDPATAKRLRDAIYSAAGNLQDPAEAYKSFRGRLPTVDALLRKRGFTEPAPSFSSPANGGG